MRISFYRTDNYGQWNAVGSPDDGHTDARNMFRYSWLPINHYLLHLVGFSFTYIKILFCTAVLLWRIYVTNNKKPHLELHVKCPIFASDCNEMWMFLMDFRNNSQYQYIIHADRQKDGHDEAKILFLLLGKRIWKAWCNYCKFGDVILRLSILWPFSSVAKSGYYLRHVRPSVCPYMST